MPRPKKIADADLDFYAVAAAHLRSEGKKQVAIAKLLGVKQPEVSRLLQIAKDKKWIQFEPSFISNEESKRLWEKAEMTFPSLSPSKLRAKVARWAEPKGIACQVTIIHAEGGSFARAAAERILELIVQDPSVKTVGILYGRTIEGVVGEIERKDVAKHRHDRRKPMLFVPLCGEPIYLENLQNLRQSASALAARLHTAVNDPLGEAEPRSPSLAGVSAYVSLRRFGGDESRAATEVATIRRFLSGIPGYAAIFGTGEGPATASRPLVDRLDGIVTGLGIVNTKQPEFTGTFLREREAQGAATLKELKTLVFGDIGGVLVPRPNIGADGERRVQELNQGLMGIGEKSLRRVASAPGKPGTIVIATGSKAEMTRAAVKQGFVTHLVISSDLADKLMDLK